MARLPCLLPVDAGGAPIVLGPEPVISVGRGDGGVDDLRLSRVHLRFALSTDEPSAFNVEVNGPNGCEFIPAGGATQGQLRSFTMHDTDEILLLPGKYHYRLEFPRASPIAAAPAEDAREAKRPRMNDGPVDCDGRNGGGGGGGIGGVSASGGGGSSGGSGRASDPELSLPPYVAPPKPAAPAGLDALRALALHPERAAAGLVYLLTDDLVVAYDVYPKARVHLLILPRGVRLDSPAQLTARHAPLLRSMARLASTLASQLRASTPGLAPLAAGFHAVPSMTQVHLHLISLDFCSDCLKNKKHFNSFATPFFVSPAKWIADLESTGALRTAGKDAEEARLKQDMRCPLTAQPLKNMPAVKARVTSAAYRASLDALDGAAAGIVTAWPPAR